MADLGFVYIIIWVLINLSVVNKIAFMFSIFIGYLKHIYIKATVECSRKSVESQ